MKTRADLLDDGKMLVVNIVLILSELELLAPRPLEPSRVASEKERSTRPRNWRSVCGSRLWLSEKLTQCSGTRRGST